MNPGALGRWRLPAAQLGLFAVFVLAWKLAAERELVEPALLPDPWQVARHIALLPFDPDFLVAVARTVGNATLGLLFATLLAVPLGLVIGANPLLHRATRLLIDMGRSFPMIALMPVLVLLLGATPTMVITVAGLATFWPILLQTCDGARQIDPVIDDTVRAFSIPPHLRFARVIFPTALPFIATGVRIGAAFSLLVAIGTELLSATGGLGRQIGLAQEGAAFGEVYALVFYCGMLGLLLSKLLAVIERRLLSWHVSQRELAL